MDAASLEGKHVTVMGLGRFGGGAGVTRWLVEHGATVLLTDIETEEKLAASVSQISDLVKNGSVALRLGGHNVSDFTTCELVVANPAVPRPWENRFLRAAWAANRTVTTEIGLTVAQLPDRARVIGVTGSAGKSTTSAMIHHILRECGFDSVFGGNIGGSLLADAHATRGNPFVVLELSSAMLCWLGGLAQLAPADLDRTGSEPGWSPHIAVVTNLSPNHLDWHGDLGHYRRSKQELLRSQVAGDIAVLPPGSETSEWASNAGVQRIVPRGETAGLSIPGKHNRQNACVAVEAAMALESRLTREASERAVRTFAGLPHRLQLAATIKRGSGTIRCFNDSKSTTPEACLLAVGAFEESGEVGAACVHLIAGGYDKGSDLSGIGALGSRLAGLYTIGKTGNAIAAASGGKATECGTVERATAAAIDAAKPGDVILLSPACASWDQFENYEKRGELFVREVRSRGELT
ncbi:MAG: UDP-N-acetylmuramoyl-L-alanine--D-glutamate ligase [Phycisphaeraceae bacterium]|nr:UDP-N-acetylmuramoyl-L-alanine--D-glutamate ligase [Phycisphaeraceae bacterium]